MRRRSKSDHPHPYKEFQNTRLWKVLDEGIRHLAENKDLKESTAREYIVGYLCKLLMGCKDTLFQSESAR
jgi:hypothetical protein